MKSSQTAKKKDIRDLLGNPKITFVLGMGPKSNNYRRPSLGQGNSVCQTR